MTDDTGASPKRRSRPLRTAAIALVSIVGLVSMMGFTGLLEHMLVYYPSRAEFPTPDPYEDVSFPTSDGLTLHGWFIPARGVEGPAPTVLHTHGNAGAIPEHEPFVSWLAAHGYNVLLFDYRDYGRSDRSPRLRNREDFIDDGLAAYEYLLSREDVVRDRVALLGFSLGAAIGSNVAARQEGISAVVLCAGFSSFPAVASDYVPLLGAVVMPGGSAPAEAVAALGDRPLLIVHGDSDGIVNKRHAGILRDAAESAGVPTEFH
ncbi:MAG: alpha/beta fold hydrolase, partial [Planctomycetota bacterium]